jgi:hypothetical protein
LGGRDWEDGGSRPALAKSSQDSFLNQWLDVVMYTCHSSYAWKYK